MKDKLIKKIAENKNVLIIGSVISTIILVLTIIELMLTKFAYYWDFVGYYENCISFLYHFKESIKLRNNKDYIYDFL